MDQKTKSPPAKRQRASRAGQARRFECKHPGCEKRYSRAEHLQRHELNHSPRQIYRCTLPQCGLTFVRADLYARHQARHDRGSSGTPHKQDETMPDQVAGKSQLFQPGRSAHDLRVTATTSSGRDDSHVAPITRSDPLSEQPDWNAETQLAQTSSTVVPREVPSSHPRETTASPSASLDQIPWTFNDEIYAQTSDNFAAWLFESPNPHDGGFNLTSGPFLDFGLDYSPQNIWDLDPLTFDFGPAHIGLTRGSISEQRRTEIASIIGQFVEKQRGNHVKGGRDNILFSADHSFPNLTTELLDRFVSNYWTKVSAQISIVHQPTFSSNSCHLLLLLAMISLGAADLVKSQPKGSLIGYKELAELIMTHLRWAIFTDEDAEPPVQLWVAQTLLLLEFYEKQWSTRRLHERAHIHHASALTLLRRGSPLVGRNEEETLPSEIPSRCTSPGERSNAVRGPSQAVDTWWVHWVRNESFNRVVFAAFFMDTLHALMYGHAADMSPYEIRTTLPCDDSLWTAKSADEVRRLDVNLKMYGIRSFPFLEGLKQSLHAQHVQTHSEARMLLMSGLLSVGWHVNRREKHLQFLETAPSVREQGRWRSLLLNAFGHWRSSFDQAVGANSSAFRDPDAATVLFHLAHMTMHADIIDCQIFSGATRLLGRKVFRSDYLNVVKRMRAWANGAFALHAVQHSTKLLYETLVKPSASRKTARGEEVPNTASSINYSCRNDPLMLRPWAVFLATLILWAHQHASASSCTVTISGSRYFEALDDQAMCCRYLTTCAAIEDPRQLTQALLQEGGLASVLNVISKDLADAEPELLVEASLRLKTCRSMLADTNFSWPPG